MTELALLEVIYNKLDVAQACKDLDEIQWARSMWQKFVQNISMSYTHTLAVMCWTAMKTLTIDKLARQLQEYEDNLTSSMWACVLAVDRLIQQMSKQAKKDRSSSHTLTKASAIKIFHSSKRVPRAHTT